MVNPEGKIARMEDIPLPDFSDLPLEKYVYAKLPLSVFPRLLLGQMRLLQLSGQ